MLSLCQHPSGDLFASGQIGKDPFVCVWDSKDCEVKSLLQNGHQRGISALDFSHDGTVSCVFLDADFLKAFLRVASIFLRDISVLAIHFVDLNWGKAFCLFALREPDAISC